MPEVADLLTPGLVIALFAWLRSDIRKLSDRLDGSEKRTSERFERLAENMNHRFDGVLREIGSLRERIAELRERMAKLEGSVEGFLAGRRDRDAA